MSEHNAVEIGAGAAVLAIAVGFFVYAATITGGPRIAQSYELMASFRSAEGIAVGTDVRMAGVKIGTVTDIELDPATFRAQTTVSVADTIEVPDDSAILIASEGLLGGSFVEILPGGSPFVLEPGDEIIDTQSSVSLITVLMNAFAGGGAAGGQ